MSKQDELRKFIRDPKNIAKAAGGSMEKRNEVMSKSIGEKTTLTDKSFEKELDKTLSLVCEQVYSDPLLKRCDFIPIKNPAKEHIREMCLRFIKQSNKT